LFRGVFLDGLADAFHRVSEHPSPRFLARVHAQGVGVLPSGGMMPPSPDAVSPKICKMGESLNMPERHAQRDQSNSLEWIKLDQSNFVEKLPTFVGRRGRAA